MFIKDQIQSVNEAIEAMKVRFQNELHCIRFDWDNGIQHPDRMVGDTIYEGWIAFDRIPLEISAYCKRDYDALREFAEGILKSNLQFCVYNPIGGSEECLDYLNINVFDFEEQFEELKRIDKLLCRDYYETL